MIQLKELHALQRRTFSIGGSKAPPSHVAKVSYLHTLVARGAWRAKTSLQTELAERCSRQGQTKRHFWCGQWTHRGYTMKGLRNKVGK